MKLDKNDIEKIANGRVNRVDGRNQTYWLLGFAASVVVGMSVPNKIAGIAIIVVGFGAFWWYERGLSIKRKILYNRLLKEWEAEQK